MHIKRLTPYDIAREANVHPSTIRKWTDEGMLPNNRDVRGWRKYPPQAVEIAKELAGTNFETDIDRASSPVES